MAPANPLQLVVHIGDAKTGISSIQKALLNGAIQSQTHRISSWEKEFAKPLA
jgi:hypothetical protein